MSVGLENKFTFRQNQTLLQFISFYIAVIFCCFFMGFSVSQSYAASFEKPASQEQNKPGYREIEVNNLPPEAKITLDQIKTGGPFAYSRDGIIFNNREKRLPTYKRGYYREYTVSTPGIKHRGARRIVSGQQGEYYYSPDHYRTFYKVKE